jgi:hypothetical protein
MFDINGENDKDEKPVILFFLLFRYFLFVPSSADRAVQCILVFHFYEREKNKGRQM